MSDIHFGVLGTLEVRIGNVPCQLGPFKQRVVLALLLCNANSIVPVDLLAEALWGDDLPRTAYKNLQVYISTLRRILFSGNGQARLAYRIRGYQIELSTSELDALLFGDLAHQGRMALRDGAVASAARTLEAALAMWRGDALMDLRGVPAIEAEAVRLENRRLSVYEDWFEAELAIGNHAHVLDVIEDLVRRHPMRERLRISQFVALNRCGRRAEALAEYDELRQLLARELGLRPSPALARLYQAILADDPSLDAPHGSTGPTRLFADTTAHLNQLTRDLEDFTGRERLTSQLVGAVQAQSRPGRVTVLSGPPGVGKTALAVHVGHLLMKERADGQILVRMRTAAWRRAPRGRSSASCCAVSGSVRGCRAVWRSGPRCTGPGSPNGRCSSSWTAPKTNPRSARCCRERGSATCSSPAGATLAALRRPTTSTSDRSRWRRPWRCSRRSPVTTGSGKRQRQRSGSRSPAG